MNKKNVLIVSHSDFPANSAVHVHHFANELIKLGLNCVVTVPHNKHSISSIKNNLYQVTQYDDIDNLRNFFDNQQPPDIVHCWTPREHVRIYCYELSIRYDFKLVIHLEDNEESIIERFLNISVKNWTSKNDHLIPYNLSHPHNYQKFLSTADGVTIIIDKLAEFVPPSMPIQTIYAGVDTHQFFPRQKNSALVKKLGIEENTTILCYTGNIHLANMDEVRCLYLAVGMRNLAGKPTILVRTGIDNNLQFLRDDELWIKKYIIEMGWVEREKIPDILALADVLIQPGKADDFNNYRFPSKIPEFLAMGKPTILPDTNIGKLLTHQENALILTEVNEKSLQSAIDLVVNNPSLADKLSKQGLNFAQNNLNWQNSSQLLSSFYDSLFTVEKELKSVKNSLTRLKFYIKDNENQHKNLVFTHKVNVENLQKQNILLQEEINAMKSSKFWKIRNKWFNLKKKIGLKEH